MVQEKYTVEVFPPGLLKSMLLWNHNPIGALSFAPDYLNWRETLRDRANRPFQGEVAAVLQGVQWLLGQFRFL